MQSHFPCQTDADRSPQIPCSLALGSLVMCLLLLLFMPDLRQTQSRLRDPATRENHSTPLTSGKSASIDGILVALRSKSVLLIVPVFLVGIFRYTTLNVLIQYASVQFGMKISTGATFYTETAIVNILLFLCIIPRMTSYIRMKYNTRPEVLDLFLVRASVSCMALGSLLLAVAPSIKILPLGKPLHSLASGTLQL